MNVRNLSAIVIARARALVPKRWIGAAFLFMRDPVNVHTVGLWLAAVVAGLVAVGYALAFRRAEHWAEGLLSPALGYWGFVIAPTTFLAAWALVRYVAPAAGGSGIPQILAANDTDYAGAGRDHVDQLLSPRTMLVKLLSSLLCVCGGGAIGREGPTLQIGASIFHAFAGVVRRILPNTSEQTWITAGAAAGLAAAFNTPLGGIVYAIEELGSQHFLRMRTALLSAVIVAGVVAQIALGSYLYLGLPKLQNIGLGFLPWALVAGALTGVMGAAFGRGLYALANRRRRCSAKLQAVIAVVCGVIVASLARQHAYATGPGVEMMTGLLFRGETADLALVATRLTATTASYLSGAAGGIFAPSLAIGAAAGSTLGRWFDLDHPNLMVILGMIGFLTGVVRTPFTSFILVLEMTDRHAAIFPMMITALAAQSTARLVDAHGFYERTKARFALPSPDDIR